MRTLLSDFVSQAAAGQGVPYHRLLLKPLQTVVDPEALEDTGIVSAPSGDPPTMPSAKGSALRYRWLLQTSQQEGVQQLGSEGSLEALEYWLVEQLGSSVCDQTSSDPLTGEQALAAIAVPPVCLIVPAARLISKAMSVSSAESRHLRSLAPFELEDHVAVDIEALHVVCSPLESGQTIVTGVERRWLEAQYSALQALGLDIAHCWDETSLLPVEADSWTLWFDGELLVRRSQYDGFALPPALATEALNLAIAEAAATQTAPTTSCAPLKIRLLAPTPTHLKALYMLLPDALRSQVSSQMYGDLWYWPNGFSAAPSSQVGSDEQVSELSPSDELPSETLRGVALGQGPFAPRIPWRRCWERGRSLIWLTSLSLVMVMLVNGLELYQQQQQQHQLRAAIEQTYRQVMPSGALVDAVKQLQHQRTQQGGLDTQSQAVPMLARVVPLMMASEGVALRRLSYHNKRRSLRLSIDARSFNQIEQLRSTIADEGLAAQLVSANVSSSAGKALTAKHQARLKINW